MWLYLNHLGVLETLATEEARGDSAPASPGRAELCGTQVDGRLKWLWPNEFAERYSTQNVLYDGPARSSDFRGCGRQSFRRRVRRLGPSECFLHPANLRRFEI